MESGDANASFYPKGELAIVQVGDNSSTDFRLTWKFDVYAQEPMSRYYVFVDAQSGAIVKKESRICNANTNGTAVTVYRGSRAIVADSYNGAYRLKETTRGLGVHTYNLQKSTNYAGAVEFTDADNLWNNVNANLDQYAGDAHWGAEMTYDFYQSMGRNSIDNAGYALNLYVHYSTNYLNAFWDGTRMTFGDGSSGYTPLTSLDITGHEISHGLDEKTANLTFQDESGALNESFSDIFGTAVEWYADSTVGNWLIGEDIGSAFRSMSNPNSTGDPDTYHGTNWPRPARGCHRLGRGKLFLPVAGNLVVLQSRPPRVGKYLGNRAAVPHRTKPAFRLPGVNQVHCSCRAMLHLDRTQVESRTAAEDVDHELGRVGNHPHGRLRVAIAVDAEIGDRIEIEEARTGQTEKIAHLTVRLPDVGEIGKAVEHIERFAACGLDHRVHLVHKHIEAGCRVGIVELGVVQQQGMFGEAKIDQSPAGSPGCLGIGPDQGKVILERLDLPDDVVAALHAAQHRVKFRQTGGRRKFPAHPFPAELARFRPQRTTAGVRVWRSDPS